jgi:hypothetical protein
MVTRAVLVSLLALLMAPCAMAQPLFANPLDTAAGYRAARGAVPDATYSYRYEMIATEADATPTVSEATIVLATDWALLRNGADAVLYDFNLNRQFALSGDRFTTTNGMADLVFRVMERQNRAYLGQVLSAVDAGSTMADCDSDAELGLAMPKRPSKGVAAFTENQGAWTFTCDGRAMGGFAAGTEKAPAAFWPTLFNAMPMHPALFKRLREAGLAPASIEITGTTGSVQRKTVLKLQSVERIVTSYPLTEAMRNETAGRFDALLGSGMGQVAADAVSGRAAGGPPSLQSWNDHVRALASTDQAAAAMLVMPSFNMFPEIAGLCERQEHAVCAAARVMNAIKASEPAPMALVAMGMAEQDGKNDEAIEAMRVIQNSRHRDHPAASGSFALALLKFKPADLAKAKAAGLPTDVVSLQAKAIAGLPYNPAYWTDAGDTHVPSYNWRNATLFYDVAFALPMPSAVNSNGVLVGKRNLFEAIRQDFPDAFLPR